MGYKARKLQFCKKPFEIIQGQIAYKNTVQCVNKQTVVLLFAPCVLACRAGVFWHEPRVLTSPSWINRCAEKNRAISIYKLSRTEYKKLVHHFQGEF